MNLTPGTGGGELDPQHFAGFGSTTLLANSKGLYIGKYQPMSFGGINVKRGKISNKKEVKGEKMGV
jgi:hypothetical protein